VRKRLPYLHIVLFIATFLSTLAAGALQTGVNPLEEPGRIGEGLPFSAALMLILLSHELSHYFASRFHRTVATLPYFVPAPSIIGTFGAFIKMKSPIATRKALIDIGASGPIVGFVVAVAASVVGLAKSEFIPVPEAGGEHIFTLGESLLFSFLSRVVIGMPPEGHDILLHPVAFAGWIGLFVTMLNLLPIGQLDGGHITFALFGPWHRRLSIALVAVLGVLGLVTWFGWAIWAVLMLVLGINHPPVLYWETPLDPRRRTMGLLALFIFFITFMPEPFRIAL
jgi:membrane-associated protease RseP (regulator of RpoE activity)